MIIQIGISRYRFIYLDLVSIVVSWVTSPYKSIVLLQISIFFSLREIRNVSTVEGEATPTRSVPLPEEEEELREEEWGGRGSKVAVARAVDDAHHFTLHFYYKY